MCGIVGVIGKKNATQILLKGLENLSIVVTTQQVFTLMIRQAMII